jgi:hypothetical protein
MSRSWPNGGKIIDFTRLDEPGVRWRRGDVELWTAKTGDVWSPRVSGVAFHVAKLFSHHRVTPTCHQNHVRGEESTQIL